MENKKIEVKLVDIANLKPHPKNPNKHTEKQIERLVKLIKELGFRVPIIVSKQSKFIVSGHARLEAAKKLGLKKVPVIEHDFKNEEKEYQFLVSDNAINRWAFLDLSQINIDMADLGPFDIELLGFENFTVDFCEKEESGEKEVNNICLQNKCPKCGYEW